MITNALHEWNMGTKDAINTQKELRLRISRSNQPGKVRYIAGVDVMSPIFAKGTGKAAVIVLKYPELDVVEISKTNGEITFPYVPGLLSFRELPLIIKAFEKLTVRPDLVIVDGQGIAHPRRFGLASHLGLIIDIPTIGCAKSRLTGEYHEPGINKGDVEYLLDDNEIIGAILRTRTGVKPVFISIGHKIDLKNAVKWTLGCCQRYRLPEPTRIAHLAANDKLKIN